MDYDHISIPLNIFDSGWADDPNTFSTLVHLYKIASLQGTSYRGRELLPNEAVITVCALSDEVGCSIRQVRTILNKLECCGRISLKSTNKYTIVELHESPVKHSTMTNERQTNDKQMTNKRQTVMSEKTPSILPNGKLSRDNAIAAISEITENESVQKAMLDWFDMRVGMRRPPTKRAMELAYRKAKELTDDANEAVALFEQSTCNGYLGIFPLKE